MNQFNQDLLELQRIDIRIEALESFLESFPDKESELGAERGDAEGKVEKKRSELEEARKELRLKERRLEDGEEGLKQIQARLNQVKTNKEYEAALKEMEDQKQANSRLEGDILVLYDKVRRPRRSGRGWSRRFRHIPGGLRPPLFGVLRWLCAVGNKGGC